uniref:Uncharacterized protein n=1 Tax=Common bean curly stunt virus TaxID=2600315 RepID=A0A5B8NF76_9GEMI|nr:hypothetical protein [Common bean curly stunt virus]
MAFSIYTSLTPKLNPYLLIHFKILVWIKKYLFPLLLKFWHFLTNGGVLLVLMNICWLLLLPLCKILIRTQINKI